VLERLRDIFELGLQHCILGLEPRDLSLRRVNLLNMLVDLRLQLPIHPFDMLILGDILQVIILGLEIPFPQLPVNGLLDDRVVFCHHLVVVLLEEFQFVDELG
jgi:hypothetical protein